MREFLLSAKLLPLVKDLQKKTIRPIVLSSMFARILQQALAPKAIQKHAGKLTGQIGVGTKQGRETAVLLTRTALWKHPESVLVQLDFKNAYGTINRSAILQQLLALKDLGLIQMFVAFYGQDTQLFLGQNEVKVSAGVLQGDSMAPLFFALGLQPLLDKLAQQEAKDAELLLAYLDDLSAVAKKETAKAILISIPGLSSELKLGLELNMDKSVCFSPSTRIREDPSWPAELFDDDDLNDGFERAKAMLRPVPYPVVDIFHGHSSKSSMFT
jgi:hypothetical protein